MRRVAVAFIVVAMALGGCHEPSAPAPSTPASGPPSAAFAWVAPRAASEAAPEEYPARLLRTSGSEAVIVPPLPARLVSLVVRPGDAVAANAAVAQVVKPDVDAAFAAVAGAERSLAILQRRRTQIAGLVADGLVRASELATLDLEIARHESERLRARAVIAGAGVARGGLVTLRTPIAGVVTEVPATLGEFRRPEDGPLARVRSRSGQRIEATLPNRPAAGVTYAFRAAAGVLPLTLLNEVPAPAGIGYLAWFEAPPGVEMPTAAEGRVQVRTSASAGAWVVPATAVGVRGPGHFVVTRSRADAGPTVVAVELVRIANADAVVRVALPEGALVATDPARAEALVDGGVPR